MAEIMRVPIDKLSPEVGYYGGGAAYARNLWPGPSGWLNVYPRLALSAFGTFPAGESPRALYQTRNILATQKLYTVMQTPGVNAYVYDAAISTAVDIGPSLVVSDYGWTFLEFGPDLILCNFDNPVKRRAAHAGALTNLITSATPPQAFTACVCRSHLVLGNTFEGATSYVQRVRWSERDNAANFLAAESTRSGLVDLTDELGGIVRVVGGDDITVLKQQGIQRLNFVGGTTYFERETISRDTGCTAFSSVVEVGHDIYFMGRRGFYVLRGGRQLQELDTSALWRQFVRPPAFTGSTWNTQWRAFSEYGVLGACDHATGAIVWLCIGRQSGLNYLRFALTYSPSSGAWGVVEGWSTGATTTSLNAEDVAVASYHRGGLAETLKRQGQVVDSNAPIHYPGQGLAWANSTTAGAASIYTTGSGDGDPALPWTLRTGALIGSPGQVRRVRLWAANQYIGLGTGHDTGYPTCRVIACNDPSVLLYGQDNSATANAGKEIADNGFFAASSTSRDADGWFYFDPFSAAFFQFEFSGSESREIVKLEAVELEFAAAGEGKRHR